MVTRRTALIAGASLAVAPPLAGRRAEAQGAWPNRTIRLIVPFTPAGTTDIAARILAERLTQRLGQQVQRIAPQQRRAEEPGRLQRHKTTLSR